MTKRRKFSPEFKREAVKLTQQPGANGGGALRCSCRAALADSQTKRDRLR